MIFLSSSQRATHISLAVGVAFGLATLSGCGIGTLTVPNSTATMAARTSGTIHGGLSPVIGATVTIYATGDSGGSSAGYGIGNALQTAISDNNGGFQFAGGYTCPANQYAYLVATGGKTGSNAVNPNSILMAALGPCSGVNSSTFTLINELTTIAAGYALNNFMTVTGDAVHGYVVGIGAPATNNAAAGCVANSYYSGCTTTSAAGLKHAFVNAAALVDTTNGQPHATTSAGAIVPVPFINTLGNVLQACVNSSGGGTDPASGLPTTATSASGTTNDGTICGKLFAYTSYTANGTPTGTLVAAGNTLSAVQNLAKRPNGSATTFDSNCSSTAGTANNAATCIYNLATTVGVYQTSMTAAPPDWMLGISYPSASFSNSTTNTFATACSNSYAGNGLLYPVSVATDISDNVVIFNADASTPVCGDIIAVGPDGTNLGISAINTATGGAVYTGVDAWGHAILPLKTGNGILFYQYNAGGTTDLNDSSVSQVFSITSTGANNSPATTTVANKAQFVAADNNSRIYVSAQNSQNTYGYLAPTTLSHTAPVYTAVGFTNTTTSALTGNSIDINNNDVTTKTANPIGAGPSQVSFASGANPGATSTNGQAIVTDTFGNAWLVTSNGTTVGTSQTVILKFPYTVTAGVLTFGANTTAAAPTYAFPTNTNTQLDDGLNSSTKYAVMDGNNVLWFPDLFGQASVAPTYGGFLRGYDTVNNYGTPQLQGCKFATASSYSVTAWSIGASSTTFTLSNSKAPAVGAVVTLNGFATSTFFNGQQVTVTASANAPSTFTVSNTFGQSANSGTEAGTVASRTGTACGVNSGDGNLLNSAPFLLYATRGIAVDSMGNLWVANGTQGQVNEILGLAAPTLPSYIHNGTSNKP